MRKFCLNEVVNPLVSEWQGKVLNPSDFRAHVRGVWGQQMDKIQACQVQVKEVETDVEPLS